MDGRPSTLLPQQQIIKWSPPCPLCQSPRVTEDHLRACPEASSIDVLLACIRIKDRGYICKRCWILFGQEEWQYHRKAAKCKHGHKNQTIALSTGSISPSIPRPLSLPEPVHQPPVSQLRSEGHFSSFQNVASLRGSNHPDKAQALADIAASILSPLLREWAERHSNVSTNVLIGHLTAATLEFGTAFTAKPIAVPTWTVIKAKGGRSFSWEVFLEKPENLLDATFLDRKLDRLSNLSRKAAVIKGLNRLSSVFPGLVQRREVPQVKMNPRMRGNVRMKDLFYLISTLLSCRRRRVVHFGLDLYLVLLSGQRFLADQRAIEEGVKGLLRVNEGREEPVLHFTMVIGKTNLRHEVCLNAQLMKLLKSFRWEGFLHKTYRLIKRMREWLGIYGYSLKDSMLTAVAAVATDLRMSQEVAGHASITNTFRYTPLSRVKDIFAITSKLVVPGVKPDFGDYYQPQLRNYLDSLAVSNVSYCEFYPEWLHLLLTRLYTIHYHRQFEQDEVMDFMLSDQPIPALLTSQVDPPLADSLADPEPQPAQEPDSSRVRRELQVLQAPRSLGSQQAEDIDELLEQLETKDLLVYGVTIKYREKKLLQENFFEAFLGHSDLRCSYCSKVIPAGQSRKRCVFCQGDAHIECPSTICKCVLSFEPPLPPTIPPLLHPRHPRKSSLKVELPRKYFSKHLHLEQQVRLLLAVRRFRYVRTAVRSPGLELNMLEDWWGGEEILHCPRFEAYLQGQYYPPIEVLPVTTIKEDPVFGSQWGLFAVQDIEPNVLIGEYAADLLHGYDLLLCRKPDSIMGYVGSGLPTDIFLAPRDYCGHVALVNCGEGSQRNCLVWKVILGECLRVILVTFKKIKKGQQLLYSYGRHYPFKIAGEEKEQS